MDCFGMTLAAGWRDGKVKLRRDSVENRRNERHFNGGQVSGRHSGDWQDAIGIGESQLESQREAGSDEPAVGSVFRHKVCEAAREGEACFTRAGVWAGCPQKGTPRLKGEP